MRSRCQPGDDVSDQQIFTPQHCGKPAPLGKRMNLRGGKHQCYRSRAGDTHQRQAHKGRAPTVVLTHQIDQRNAHDSGDRDAAQHD